MNGKGDTPRPLSVPKHVFDDAWERTFGKKKSCPKCGGPTEEWNQAGRLTPAIRCVTNGCTWFL